jgi:SPX domain protein involved in polyphosphate accumulation
MAPASPVITRAPIVERNRPRPRAATHARFDLDAEYPLQTLRWSDMRRAPHDGQNPRRFAS